MPQDNQRRTGVDEQYSVERSPVEREMAEGEAGGETARNIAGGLGLSFGLVIAAIFILFVLVLLGFIVANFL